MVEVVYRGGNMDGITSNAASEATLLKLLAKIGKGSGAGNKAQELYNASQKEGTEATVKGTKAEKAQTKATQASTDATKKMTKAQLGFFGTMNKYTLGLGSGIANVGEAAMGLAGELLGSGESLSDFSQHITGLLNKIPLIGPMIGGPLQLMVQMLDKNIEMFRQLSTVGVDFGDRVFEITSLAGKMGVSVDRLAGSIADNSQMLSLAFGGASKGAKAFTGIMGEVREFSGQFARLGISTEEQLEYTADYLDLQRISGRAEMMSQRQLSNGAKTYIQELDLLARMTGRSRKELSESMKKEAGGQAFAWLQTLDPKLRASMTAQIVKYKGLEGSLGETMTQMLATGAAIGQQGRYLMRTNPEILENTRLLREGKITQEEFDERMRGSVEQAKRFVENNAQMIQAAKARGSAEWDQVEALARSGELFKKRSEAEVAQMAAKATEQKKVTEFGQQIEKIKAQLMGLFVDSGVFTVLVEGLNKIGTWMSKPENKDLLKNLFDKMAEALKTLLSDFATGDMSFIWDKYVLTPLKAMGGSIKGWIKEMIFGPSEHKDVEDQKSKLEELKALREEIKAGGKDTKVMADGTIESLTAVDWKIAALEKNIADSKAADSTGGGFCGGLIDKVTSMEGILTTLGIGGAVYIAIKGFAGLLGLFGTGKVILGAAVVAGLFLGTGYAIKLAGQGIKMAGEGLQVVSQAMSDLSEIKEVANLKEVAGIMGDLAGALTKFAIGGVIAGLMSEGTLEKLAGSLKAFEDVDGTKLNTVGPGIAALYEGTSKFTGDGAWEGFSKWVGSLFGGSSNDFEKMAEGIAHFQKLDGNQLASLGSGLSGIAEFVAAINTETDLNKQVTAIKSLIEEVGKYQKAYGKMSDEMKSSLNIAVSNSTKESVEALNQLNTVLESLLHETRTSNTIGKQIVGAVDNAGTIG